MQAAFLLLVFLAAGVRAFVPRFSPASRAMLTTQFAIDPTDVSPEPMPMPETYDDAKLFDMNKNVRLGRSRDQDGKSNIWSIEPRMEVDGEDGGSKKNLLIAGVVVGAAIASLPLFNAFSSLFPDPTDY